MSGGSISRALNRMTGGKRGESLCARLVRTRGSACLACRFIGLFLGRDHCLDQFIFEQKERRK
jgi:hypothetical protein